MKLYKNTGLKICERVILLFVIFAFFIGMSIFGDDKALGSVVLFDGQQHMSGKGFALPRGLSKFELSTINTFSGSRDLFFDLQFDSGWTGCGWNWTSWNYDAPKTSIKSYSKIIFYISVSPCSIHDITFQLTSATKPGTQDGFGKKVSIFPFIKKRDTYTKIEIDLSKLEGQTLDPAEVWGFNIGVFAGKASNPGRCKMYIDNIELIP
jgi:hypothetical protein